MSFVALFNLSPASIVLAVFGLPVRFGSVPKPAALLYCSRYLVYTWYSTGCRLQNSLVIGLVEGVYQGFVIIYYFFLNLANRMY